MSVSVDNGSSTIGDHSSTIDIEDETTSMSKEDHYMRWRKEGVLSVEEICSNIRQMNGQDLIVIK